MREPINDIEATGRCCCAGCIGMGPCDLDPISSEDDEPIEAYCRVCGCTENEACEGGCYWVFDPEMGDLRSACAPEAADA